MWKKILILLGIISTIVFTIFIYLVSKTAAQIKNGEYLEANKTAATSLVIVEPISKITLSKNSEIELLKHSLYLIKDLPLYSESLIAASNLNSNEKYIFDITNFKNTLSSLNSHVQIINSKTKQSKIIKKIIDQNYLNTMDKLSSDLPDFIKVLENLSSKNQKMIVIFQNSDEIRATGGFMGSYAVLDIIDGKIVEITTEDIYDADGQFKGFVEAPSGVKEFLSDGQGLRLPNANWHPDFPTSAQQILQFFALGNKKNITTLVAINPDYAKIILSITGNITLKDYSTIVDSKNITEVLRSRRSDFFPGSKQKKHLLSQLLTQLQIKISKLDEKSKLDIAQQTLNQLILSNIQLYSNINEVEQIFSKHNFRQELEYKKNSDYIYLVESNVGINKANKNISRKVVLEITDFEKLVTINFKNNNLSPITSNLTGLIDRDQLDNTDKVDHLGYVNYQRVILKLDQKIEFIKYNEQQISQWDENIIKNSKGDKFKEIGFVITLKEQESSVLEIKIKSSKLNGDSIYIQKQPGVPATPYTVKKNGIVFQNLLEKDFLVEK